MIRATFRRLSTWVGQRMSEVTEVAIYPATMPHLAPMICRQRLVVDFTKAFFDAEQIVAKEF
jgi:hypothetical protein